MFKFIGSLMALNSPLVSIPQYRSGTEEDSIDLQIKSLIYMFKRFHIPKLGPFLTLDNSFNYIEEPYTDDILINDKLDKIYNIEQFQKKLINDENRILIDYIKNKFRSMLILSDTPNEIKNIPELDDLSFKFSILKPDASNEEYIQILLNESNFYIEHNITDELKIELITTILYNQREVNPILTKDDRSLIIETYLSQLAFHVQVDRIYKATLRSKERIDEPRLHTKQSIIKSQPLENSYVTKPVPLFPNVKYQSPSRRKVTIYDDSLDDDETPRKIRASPSKMKLTQHDLKPPKLNKKQSQTILKIDYKYQELTRKLPRRNSGNSDFSDQGSLSTLLTSYSMDYNLLSEWERGSLYDQSKIAVRVRIDRERNMIHT